MGTQCCKPTEEHDLLPKKKGMDGPYLLDLLKRQYKPDQLTRGLSKNIVLDDIKVLCVLGEGAFAKVYLVKRIAGTTTQSTIGDLPMREEDKFFAMKVIKK